jgi:hypothetical protein
MPPWKADRTDGPFVGQHPLSRRSGCCATGPMPALPKESQMTAGRLRRSAATCGRKDGNWGSRIWSSR